MDSKNNKLMQLPPLEWNTGFICSAVVYSMLLKQLIYDLGKQKLTEDIIEQFERIIREHRMDIYDEYYSQAGFLDRESPFIRVNRNKSDKKHVIIEWYEPREHNK